MALSVYPSGRPSVHPSVCSVVHNSCGQDISRTTWLRVLKLSVYTSYGRRKKPIYFKVKCQISMSLGLYKEFWYLHPCEQDISRTKQSRLLKLSMHTSYENRKKPIYFQGQKLNFKVAGPLQRNVALGSLWAGYSKNYEV